MTKAEDRLELALDQVMERLLFHRPEPLGPHSRVELFPDSVFDDIDLLDFGDDASRMFFTDVTPEVIWPVDQCSAIWREHCADGDRPHLQLFRLKTCGARELRGLARLVPRYSAMAYHAHYYDNGISSRERQPVGFLGGRWRALDEHMEFTSGNSMKGQRYILRGLCQRNRQEISDACLMALSSELTNRYEWSVSFRIDTSPALKLYTDPSGIRALFKTRDRGNRSRRSALRHWVREHYRQRRDDPIADIWVREHLRGAEAFRWQGYDCRVNVSAYDLERAEWAQQQRRAG